MDHQNSKFLEVSQDNSSAAAVAVLLSRLLVDFFLSGFVRGMQDKELVNFFIYSKI